MRLFRLAVWRPTCLVIGMMLTSAGVVFAQNTSTINGRVLDQADAVLPGVTVTVTNQNTGVARTTVSNDEGVYYLPGLEPGAYNLTTDLPGFAAATREGVNLGVNATMTLDMRMSLAGVTESVTVTGASQLIEVTQSKVASSIETTELQNLPMIARNVSGMLALLPGAVQIEGNHRSKFNVGSVSYGGSAGANVIPSVDGADNRDNQFGGPLITFSTEALEQFQLATSQFNAADGRTGGAALTMVTKSGTNVFHGSAFGLAAATSWPRRTSSRRKRIGTRSPSAASSSADRPVGQSCPTGRSSLGRSSGSARTSGFPCRRTCSPRSSCWWRHKPAA